MKPLALSGRAHAVTAETADRFVLRLRLPQVPPKHPADAAIVRSPEDLASARSLGFTAIVAIGEPSETHAFGRTVALDARFSYLADGDLVGVRPRDRSIRTLYRKSSPHNAFLVTERCNHWCLMCSQPPRDVDDDWILDEIAECISLVEQTTGSLGFTGGEPLLRWQPFVNTLALAREQLPSVALHVLTNGRAFARSEVVSAWADVRHPDLTAGIPIYSAVNHIHDYVVQSKGALDETLLGILRLKDRGQRVEVRVVLHAVTVPRLIETAGWLARNLPFLDHVALMGLEEIGFATANHDLLWIDPVDYQPQLTEAVTILRDARIPVSVYNLPLCLIERSVWPAAVQSISDWKNGYLPECESCSVRSQCAGFFTSGRPRFSRGIAPI